MKVFNKGIKEFYYNYNKMLIKTIDLNNLFKMQAFNKFYKMKMRFKMKMNQKMKMIQKMKMKMKMKMYLMKQF